MVGFQCKAQVRNVLILFGLISVVVNGYQPANNAALMTAVKSWCSDANSAQTIYGQHINAWDTSSITSMAGLFCTHSSVCTGGNQGCSNFNDDLSSWDVSHVTDMKLMFNSASSFTSDLSSWDVSQVTDMLGMFVSASSFNSDLSSWDVSKVTDMESMFNSYQVSSSFTSDLSSWDVSQVTNMHGMFLMASSFNSDLSSWDVSKVTNMFGMFAAASSFNSDLSSWNVSRVTNMENMFASASSFSQKMCWVLNPSVSMPNVVSASDGALVCDCPRGASYSNVNGAGTCGWTSASSTAAPTAAPTANSGTSVASLSTGEIAATVGGVALLLLLVVFLVHRWYKDKDVKKVDSSNVEMKDFREVEQGDNSEMVSKDPVSEDI